jgi:apolipoprotein N-acyltransferase
VRGTIAPAVAVALLLLGAERIDGRLAWLVCAPLAFVTGERMPLRRAVLLGVLFASVFAVLRHLGWLSEAAERYFGLSPLAAWTASFVLCVACAPPLGALLGLLLGCASRLARTSRIVAVALVWAAWESLARATFPSYPWVGLAATQVEQIRVLQLASVGGQMGLSLVLGLGGSALGAILGAALRGGDRRHRLHRCAAGAAGFALLVASVGAWGARRLATASPPGPALCSLAAVDAHVARPVSLQETLARYDEASLPAVAFRPDAIVWPESALPANPFLDADLLRGLRRRSADWEAVLLVGGPRFEWSEEWQPRLFNSVFRITPSDAVEA